MAELVALSSLSWHIIRTSPPAVRITPACASRQANQTHQFSRVWRARHACCLRRSRPHPLPGLHPPCLPSIQTNKAPTPTPLLLRVRQEPSLHAGELPQGVWQVHACGPGRQAAQPQGSDLLSTWPAGCGCGSCRAAAACCAPLCGGRTRDLRYCGRPRAARASGFGSQLFLRARIFNTPAAACGADVSQLLFLFTNRRSWLQQLFKAVMLAAPVFLPHPICGAFSLSVSNCTGSFNQRSTLWQAALPNGTRTIVASAAQLRPVERAAGRLDLARARCYAPVQHTNVHCRPQKAAPQPLPYLAGHGSPTAASTRMGPRSRTYSTSSRLRTKKEPAKATLLQLTGPLASAARGTSIRKRRVNSML